MADKLPDLVEWPSIEGLHNVLRNIEKSKDQPDDPESSFGILSSRSDSKVPFDGKIKLHGMNCAIVVADNAFQAQSRKKVFPPNSGGAGIAGYAKKNSKYFSSLYQSSVNNIVELLSLKEKPDYFTVFGEWAGPGVQKTSSVAVGKVKSHIWAVFAVVVPPSTMISDPEHLKKILIYSESTKLPDGTHILPWSFHEEINLLNAEEMKSTTVPKLNEHVLKVDTEDPWIKEQFGIAGPGEGIVWYPRIEAKEGNLVSPMQLSVFAALAFKTKGEAHQMVEAPVAGKGKGGGNAKKAGPVRLEPPKAANEEEFAKMFVSMARGDQGLAECHEVPGEKSKEEKFIEWMVIDVKKESAAELEVSNLKWTPSLENHIREQAKSWFEKNNEKKEKV